jgi:hypothetical protein
MGLSPEATSWYVEQMAPTREPTQVKAPPTLQRQILIIVIGHALALALAGVAGALAVSSAAEASRMGGILGSLGFASLFGFLSSALWKGGGRSQRGFAVLCGLLAVVLLSQCGSQRGGASVSEAVASLRKGCLDNCRSKKGPNCETLCDCAAGVAETDPKLRPFLEDPDLASRPDEARRFMATLAEAVAQRCAPADAR